jgi:nitroimidazol reductase NimA-like FMN-containing flavoprotein (pyridoxamine 5'-phosphate oxidase superfamily)
MPRESPDALEVKDMNEPFDLSTEECRDLLSAGLVGRVAVCTPVGPHVVPVNYAVVDDAIVVRTSPYSVLGSHARGSILAVEVDQFDYERQRGWSVVARGRAEVVTTAEELKHIRSVWDPNAWAAGQRNLYVRVPWSELTGRRLGPGWQPTTGLPVSRVV